jgi:molybdenum cofactor biosynthesis enzyme MoaA
MDHYCSTKFTDLQVHVGSRLLYNCCVAYPERADINWLEKNPGKIFETNTMIKDRKLMLENKSCDSCHFGCYKYEQQGLSSTRLEQPNAKKITEITAPLRNLQISLSNDCNLKCVYCNSEWSSSWHRELADHGDIKLDGTVVKNNNWSTLWSKIKQKDRSVDSKFFQILLKEIKLAKNIQSITVLGGEPLLHNQLFDIIESVGKDKKINLVTGLGVNTKRLQNIIKKLHGKKINFRISGESTNSNFEFIRHGLKWKDYCDRIKIIQDMGFSIELISTISNISLLDFPNFYEKFSKTFPISLGMVRTMPFLLPNVLDRQNKDQIVKWMSDQNNKEFTPYVESLSAPYTEIQKKNCGQYINELARRRKVDLNFIPSSFKDWCGIRD